MKAEDTVIHNRGCMADGYITGGCLGDKEVHYECTCGREEQAEISFKAGKTLGVAESLKPALKAIEDSRKAGIKEVFDFLHENSAGIMMNEYALEAQLKKWGLK